MRRLSFLIVGSILVSLSLAARLHAITRADALFQEAEMKESGERDPEAAVALYQDAIEQAGHDRSLIARAALRMGECYERLGKSKEAEEAYRRVIDNAPTTLNEDVQTAQTNLNRLQSLKRQAPPPQMMLVHEFHESRVALSLGPDGIRSGTHSSIGLTAAVRVRLSAPTRPLALFGELGMTPALGSASVLSETKPFSTFPADQATLKFRYQGYLAFITELPHGRQRLWVPEMGIGAALTESKWETAGQTFSESPLSPYLTAGVHFFPERQVSFLVVASYTATPYVSSENIASPPHSQSFDVPNSIWTVGVRLQVKIGKTEVVMRPKP